jgi:hypothetical protein
MQAYCTDKLLPIDSMGGSGVKHGRVKGESMRKFLFSVVLSSAISGIACNTVFASAVTPTLTVNNSSLVQMIDGKDWNDSATVRASITKGKNKQASDFDFGFMSGGNYVPITSQCRDSGVYDFSAGALVDFAVRLYGLDDKSGTGDDKIYRLSDSAHYATLIYFGSVNPKKSRDPELTDKYYRGVRIGWDLDLDNKIDIRALVIAKGHSRFDGVTPASPVPLPAGIWLMATGLLGLMRFVRRKN